MLLMSTSPRQAVLDRIKPERVCKTCYGLLDTKASKVSGDISDCSGSDDDEYFHVEHVSIGAANAVKAERAEATVAVEATMITGYGNFDIIWAISNAFSSAMPPPTRAPMCCA